MTASMFGEVPLLAQDTFHETAKGCLRTQSRFQAGLYLLAIQAGMAQMGGKSQQEAERVPPFAVLINPPIPSEDTARLTWGWLATCAVFTADSHRLAELQKL